MRLAPLLRHVMTVFPYAVDRHARVDETARHMRLHAIRHLPVVQNGVVEGMITDRDIKPLIGSEYAFTDRHDLKVGDVMAQDCYVVDLATPLHAVLRHMAEHGMVCAAVTRHGILEGIFTATDACRAFADHLEGLPPIDDDEDNEISDALPDLMR